MLLFISSIISGPDFFNIFYVFGFYELLSMFGSIFDFMVSPGVLPWVLIGTAVSFIGICIFWSRCFFRG